MNTRTLARIIPSVAASDGAGVKLRRSLGNAQTLRHDPFLMLDEFYSDDPQDYLRGFPAHPHRGFETVTYMLDGHMRHEDHLGHRGDLGPGDVQWMTAGRGIVHSEMPQQTEGRMRGFQLWINLPAKEKMRPPAYRDIAAREVPVVTLECGGKVRVIAGTLMQEGRIAEGPISGGSTNPLYLDVVLPAGGQFMAPVEPEHNAFIYLYEGEAWVGDDRRELPMRAAGLLSAGEQVRVDTSQVGARFLLLAGKPLGEPVVQYGPFVMNTRQEIEQALADYRDGTLTAPAGSGPEQRRSRNG
ncbi:pirin family protein [Methyloterricola oryzae]|uniref:pirin family protein n=1 Tax=Methyloterricola oryzae TaxID=1495050 RepID=UPI0005EBE5C2|nr:pirin family protein [Methyloterricola oryzae]